MRLFKHASLLSLFALAGCASGSAIITGKVRPPISAESVQLYLQPPAQFEVVGLVKASSDAGWTEQGSVDYAVKELKKQAAKVGANGILLSGTGTKTTSTVIVPSGAVLIGVPVEAQALEGQAIFVEQP